MSPRPLLAALLIAATSIFFQSAQADEMDFVFVDRIPAVEGAEIRRFTNFDPARGISFRKAVYEERLDGLVVVSISVELFCGRAVPDEATEPTIVAFKHVPINPQSFAAATLNDVFTHAYVRDTKGAIRAYTGLHASEMEQMTDEITPACQET